MSILHAVRLWCRAWFRRGDVEREMEREMRVHLAMEREHQERHGRAPEEAARRAALAFGGVERYKEAVRDEWGIRLPEEILADTRYALRRLRQAPLFTAMTVGMLALGIGAATAATAVVTAVLLRPLPYRDADRMVFVTEAARSGDPMLTSFPNYEDWRARAHAFESVAAYAPVVSMPAVAGTEAVRGRLQRVTGGAFPLLGVQPVLGRGFAPDELVPGAAPVAMVAASFWRRYLGGSADLASLSLRVNGGPVAVVGVLPDDFELAEASDLWMPLEPGAVRVRGAGNYWVIARLRAGVSMASAQREMNTLAAGLKQEYGEASISDAVVLTSLLDRVVAGARTPLQLLLGAALFVLIVTCAGVAILQLERGETRQREMGVRRALGARRWRLARQLVTEQGVLAVLGGGGGIALAWAAVAAVRRYGGEVLPRLSEIRLDGAVLATSTITGMLVVIGFGLAPITRLLRRSGSLAPMSLRDATAQRRHFSILVATEAAVTVVMLVGATLLVRSVLNIITADVGYDRHGLISANLPMSGGQRRGPPGWMTTADQIREAFRSLPGAQAVALTSQLPFERGGNRGPVLIPPFGDPNVQQSWAAIAGLRVITPDYFSLLRVPLLRGRWLEDTDREDSRAVLVNAALAAKLWPGQDPIGRQLRALVAPREEPFTVVGVVGNTRSWLSEPGSQLEFYATIWEIPQSAWQLNAVVKFAGSTSGMARLLAERLRDVDPDLAPVIRTLDQSVAGSVSDRQFIAGTLVAFALIVLILTIAGVFGSVAYAVARRTREIGIRLAVGATGRQVWVLVQRDVLGSALLGGVVGVGLALPLGSVVAALLYGMTPHDPRAFAAALAAALVAIAGAAAIPAWRATRVDPIQAVRVE